jgi:hypothetical protein
MTGRRITERINPDAAALRVDADAGVIRGVKLLGLQSDNGRRYPEAVIRAAAPKYEGVRVFVNHPPHGGMSDRPFQDWAGVVENVRARPDGLYGDLRLRKQGRHFHEIIEGAQQFNGAWGMSHVASIDSDFRGGVEHVSRIVEVYSVDVVCEPATTSGVFESRSAMIEETVDLRRRLAAAEQEHARLLGKQRQNDLAHSAYEHRFSRVAATRKSSRAKEVVRRVLESLPTPAPAVDLDAALELVESVLLGKDPTTASMGFEQRVQAAMRRLRDAIGRGKLASNSPAAGAGHCDNSAHARAGAAPFNIHQPH